jgi:leucyl aminopeptidase (aminopeptidase T)
MVDQFLEAEKVISTIHVAFGGGDYPSKTHLDLLIENPNVDVFKKGECVNIMRNGKF